MATNIDLEIPAAPKRKATKADIAKVRDKAAAESKAKPNGAAKAALTDVRINRSGKPKAAAKPKAKGKGQSKTSLIASLLLRPGGCVRADILEATGWPSVSYQWP